MSVIYKYWLGDTGPLIYRSEGGELPLRVQLVDGGEEVSVALNVPSIEGGSPGQGAIVGSQTYSAYQDSHRVARHLGLESL